MKKLTVAVLCAAAACAAPNLLYSQAVPREPTKFGLQVSYGNDSEFGVGGRVRYGLQGLFPSAPLAGIGSVDIFFPGNSITWVEANYNVVYNFRIQSSPRVVPYSGAGLNFVYVDTPGGSDTELGLNLLAGVEFRPASRGVTPFLELRGVISGGDQLVLTGGIKF